MKKLRVLVLMHPSLVPPENLEGYSEKEIYVWKTEYDVVRTLRELGHEARPLGVQDELLPIRTVVTEWRPHVVFNLLEEFHGMAEFDQHVVSLLELLRVPYTGCNPRGLVLARDKGLSKKLAVYHRIRTPGFVVFRRGAAVRPRRGVSYPAIVKSLTEHASLGISQASVVDGEEKMTERVKFIHERIGTDAIVEQFIEGRELYVGILGNRQVKVLPTWELVFDNLARGSAAIATARAKHNPEYQEKRGIYQQPADGLPEGLAEHVARTSKRIFRILELDGYARIDYRLSTSGHLYFLEANPNPEIAAREEFASAAQEYGLGYPQLLQKILDLGLRRGRSH
ncbi:MAG: D-alanine-D-alanine ligase [Candidatus Binatota bacterium]|nr:D-alanine-D-alanine ligase [Candidatus Binatota bacterium]